MSARRPGFTIIELLVVIIIIGILLAAAGISFTTARQRGRDGQRMGDILLTAQAIDQSATTNRGVYPANVQGGQVGVMCANELQDAANTNKFDLSIFSTRKIPSDPVPVTQPALTRGCQSYQDGYTYYSIYANTLAKQQGYTYLLEVGLEQDKGTDETTFVSGKTLGVPDVITPRFQYFFRGKFCGLNC